MEINNVNSSKKVSPKTKNELREIIKKELKRQGPDADLNFIDTSKITDMSHLFNGLKISNIKIDKWDVSNVIDMSYMFQYAFRFKSDLSLWCVLNITNVNNMFKGAVEMENNKELQPKITNS